MAQPLEGEKAIGFRSDKVGAEPAVWDQLKAAKLPALCELNVKLTPTTLASGAVSFKMRITSAKVRPGGAT
ncbi:hypothetical protein E4T66_20455 [Sinimarinibacterium sp. CAU 1509]|uniref:hypothetical protein n=1 Tax=Sinimarinibacterium sp. CAU 1509 TaxID=2562283 RepID=UPI0010ACFA31|nr:hypothetical protein [Sinimarinibacterium sp. CAU 1509]TJY55755.1 hypothetical protein E4T66_20455 [Sinimarinibacterium sp. CAU 1509]